MKRIAKVKKMLASQIAMKDVREAKKTLGIKKHQG